MPKNCPKCEVENNDLAKFCKGCGFDFRSVPATESLVSASLICGKCLSRQTPGAKFCKSCGDPIVANPPLLVSSPAPEVLPEPPFVPLALEEPISPALPEPFQPTVALPVESVAPSEPPVAPTLTIKPVSPPVPEPSTGPASKPKKSLSPLVLGGLAMACVGLAAGLYWLMTAGPHESSPTSTPAAVNAPVVVPPSGPKATASTTAVEAVPGSVTVPVTAAASTLSAPVLIAAPAVTHEAPHASLAPTRAPVSSVKQEPVPAPLPMAGNNPEVEATPVLKREQRTADEVAMAQKTNRQAIAKQKERDKATLSHTNKTLDDLLK